jgi:hypothetical protein
MGLYSIGADKEFVGDLLVFCPESYHGDYFDFPRHKIAPTSRFAEVFQSS